MRYTYTAFTDTVVRINVFTRFEEISNYAAAHKIEVYDNAANELVIRLVGKDDFAMWADKIARDSTWMDREQKKKYDALEECDGFHVKQSDVQAKMTLGELKVKDHINPPHYQNYLSVPEIDLELQWLETKQYQSQWRDPKAMRAAVLLQADKYLSRLGEKDCEVQELKKGIWYLKFLAAYMANGNKPIRVKDIDSILGKF